MSEYIVTLRVADDGHVREDGTVRTSRDVRDVVTAALRPLSRADAIAPELYVRDITVAEVV